MELHDQGLLSDSSKSGSVPRPDNYRSQRLLQQSHRWLVPPLLLALLLPGLVVLVGGYGTVTVSAGAVAAVQPPERLPVRLLAEAEDFTVVSPGWEVMHSRDCYFHCTFAITFHSRMACLGAPEQLPPGHKAVAEQIVHIPYADTYQVLARYEQPFNFSCEFTLEIEQNGRVVAALPFGRLTDPKIWAFNGHKREAMVRYVWSGTDNIVWQHPGSVRLEAGPARLRLIATEQRDGVQRRKNAARRHVDVICLTNDTAGMEAQKKASYLEFDGWLVQDGDLFVRFTNPKDAATPVVPVVAPHSGGQHSPYYVHIRDWPTITVLKSGRAVTPTSYQMAGPRSEQVRPQVLAPVVPLPKDIPPSEFLQPGESSGWIPLGQAIDALHHCQWYPQVLVPGPKGKGTARSSDVYLRLEFGLPDGRGGIRVVRDLTVKGPASGLSPACFDIPGCVNPNPALTAVLQKKYWLPRIRTQKEILEGLNAEVARFPKVGSVPKRLPVYNILGFSGALDVFPEARQLAQALGDNTAVRPARPKLGLVAHWPDPSVDWIKKQEASRKGGFDDLYIVSYGDEIHLPAVPLTDDEFAAWLRARGISYDGPIKYTRDRSHPLYYYAQIAAKEKGGARYAEGTAYYKSKGVLTGANYSPHANFLVTEIDYIRPFKLRAMSMPWSEDYAWQVADFSPQVVGYLVSGLRAGAKYDNLPIHMYVMPHSPGQIPSEFRQSFYTAIAHGARIINYFCASPSAVGNTENYVDSDDLPMWRMIHKCTHEIGIFEDYILDGQVRPARVGLLLSSVDEIITGVTNFNLAMHNNERKAIYLALRHAQVPVDFLSEDDVLEGRAKDYTVIYLTQQYLHTKALDALQKWVEAGGTLVALCGGGFWNEFQKENPAASRLYGAQGPKIHTDPNLVPKYLLKENVPFLPKHDLPFYEPIDTVSWDLIGSLSDPKQDRSNSPTRVADVPVIVWKQPLTVTDGTVVGTFRDGSPAVVRKRHGRGQAVLFGFLPGQAYLKAALPPRPVDRGASPDSFAHFLPRALDRHLRARLVDDFLASADPTIRPVRVNAELVETTCIDTPPRNGQPARLAVPMINWSGTPLQTLSVVIHTKASPKRLRSVERGELQFTTVKDGILVQLPLDVADMLLIDF
ncbi:MAG: hypothetical protein NZU63_00490 [Gemmataceae bacterium]|nr:hypothetical protein [Gemmataceae bacterium]